MLSMRAPKTCYPTGPSVSPHCPAGFISGQAGGRPWPRTHAVPPSSSSASAWAWEGGRLAWTEALWEEASRKTVLSCPDTNIEAPTRPLPLPCPCLLGSVLDFRDVGARMRVSQTPQLLSGSASALGARLPQDHAELGLLGSRATQAAMGGSAGCCAQTPVVPLEALSCAWHADPHCTVRDCVAQQCLGWASLSPGWQAWVSDLQWGTIKARLATTQAPG